MDKIEEKIVKTIDENREEILKFANDIYDNAELGYKEFQTSEKFKEFLKSKVERITDDLAITGVKGYINTNKKDNFSLALLGELDALRIQEHIHANKETQAAHCCGHHAQLAGVIGSAFALTDREIASHLDGQLIFFATPAEEYGEVEFKNKLIEEGKIKYGGGKCELIRIGAFNDIDACIAHHISMDGISVGNGSTNGFVSKLIKIQGKAAHAAAEKEKGINALQAASLGLQALAYNKETFRDEDHVRVHPIMTKGGDLVNVIPDEAIIETLVRGKTKEAFEDAAYKTDRAFKAGADALDAKCKIETMPGYLPSIPQQFPEELVDIVKEVSQKHVSIVPENQHDAGSTDVGDVQHLLPVLTFRTGGASGGLHQTAFSIEDEDEAYILTAKIFALISYRILKNNAELGKKLKADYKPVFNNNEEYAEYLNKFYSVTV